jgi:hypothetical protein
MKTRQRRQLNIRMDDHLYRALEAVAKQERRSIPQAAQRLLEDGLRLRVGQAVAADDVSSQELTALAAAGGSFDWLAEEPDLYDDSCGEPV